MQNIKAFFYKKISGTEKNLRGQAIATSTWTDGDDILIYTRTEHGWNSQWHAINAWYLPDTVTYS